MKDIMNTELAGELGFNCIYNKI